MRYVSWKAISFVLFYLENIFQLAFRISIHLNFFCKINLFNSNRILFLLNKIFKSLSQNNKVLNINWDFINLYYLRGKREIILKSW